MNKRAENQHLQAEQEAAEKRAALQQAMSQLPQLLLVMTPDGNVTPQSNVEPAFGLLILSQYIKQLAFSNMSPEMRARLTGQPVDAEQTGPKIQAYAANGMPLPR